ncbi:MULTISPECIES: hypothetical protein [Aneurinibacillus]|jgi:hypothetical protein|uniref:Uncharacterized protein n=1 Tax=Aneurinibacillus danicus TaxID=267746 RepID=A0A511VC81_9BACL|nr:MULTISPECIES: hypothetical protein [Aneurinibacillus]GEN34842.1 hypothetical protein ADA01nite_23020 [Aneurinibacillus danicus]
MKRWLLIRWHHGWSCYHAWHVELYRAVGHKPKESAELDRHLEQFTHHVEYLLVLKKRDVHGTQRRIY